MSVRGVPLAVARWCGSVPDIEDDTKAPHVHLAGVALAWIAVDADFRG